MYIRPGIYQAEGPHTNNYWCPEEVTEYSETFDGVVRTWKEYVPPAYQPGTPVPLVLSLHGGNSGTGHDLHGAERRSAWATVAQEEGFIVLYPQSLTPELAWNAWNDYGEAEGMKDDLRYLDWLLDKIMHKYSIDPQRVYLHGQSFGDVMGSNYVLTRGEKFAAAALFSGPACADRYVGPDGLIKFGREQALPVLRIHGSEDLMMPMGRFHRLGEENTVGTCDPGRRLMGQANGALNEQMRRMKMELFQLPNIYLWTNCNACRQQPQLSLRGNFNVMTYPGSPDFTFYAVEGGRHNPDYHMADYVWRYFFSGYRRVNGEIVKEPAKKQFVPDKGSVALAAGAAKAYVDNRLLTLSTPARVYNGAICLTPEDAARIYPTLEFRYDDEKATVTFRRGEQTLQLAAGNRTGVWCGELSTFSYTRFEDGCLFVPIADVARLFFGQYSSQAYDALFLSAQPGKLAYDMAYMIGSVLGTIPAPTPLECLKLEQAELANPKNYLG